MACPHLAYRESDGDRAFETARAYCTVVDEFVRPVRADTCTERYGLSPERDCEYFRAEAGLDWDE
ncbi:hypothetical protein [Candidatus Halobonum tyrrellensis]|uniref:Uncharacterized protein n=1 Tax=Candidatus Halobonum tyrrellensis G22 TaxID=1324957 RepID=V4GVA0_9EURY|nr:hypothetical protein [Candidatus Halobonum tyrrellensis]ESP89091.1 hypothetical protein K933_05788 [Candidatus Halobonum tyrrellensis G22]